jgi:predicted RNase H-like HicB family nuclease
VKYIVVYEQTPNNWGAYVPDLPGCVAVADTRDETETMIREAIDLYIEALLEEQQPVPQPGAWTGVVDVKTGEGSVLRQ